MAPRGPDSLERQLLAVYALNGLFAGLAARVGYGWTGSLRGAAACFAAVLTLAAVHPAALSSDWMPYLYVPAYVTFLIAAASVAAGRGRDAWVLALTGWFLIHGHACFLGLRPAAGTACTMLHVVGVLVAACGTGLAAWRLPRDRDRVAQLLVAGVAINLAAFVLSTRAGVVTQAREIAPVLPFSAALAGRLLAGPLLGGPLLARRLRSAVGVPLLLVVLLGYLAGLAGELSKPPAAAQNQQLTSWLAARHLHTGLSGYWESNVVTLTSGDRIQIRQVVPLGGRLAPRIRESKASWYAPDRNTANFVVLSPGVPGYPGFTQEWAVLATFGRPARTYHVGSYTVLVWNKNLLRGLG